MDDMPGVTRDRHYGYAEWIGKFFTVIDTGGYVTGSDDKFESQIRKQVALALDECSAVIFMVDCKAGLTGYDKEFAQIIRRSKKPVFLAANKADTPSKTAEANEFYELGMGEVYTMSAENGSGTGELLDELVKVFPDEGIEGLKRAYKDLGSINPLDCRRRVENHFSLSTMATAYENVYRKILQKT